MMTVDVRLLLQVLYFCPGLREGIKELYNLSKRKDKKEGSQEEADQSEVGEIKAGIDIKDLKPLYIPLVTEFYFCRQK